VSRPARQSTNTLKVFLNHWTDKTPYLAALAAGEPRRNLDGTLAGELTENERGVARKTLDARKS
jgi:sRNA-binding protein